MEKKIILWAIKLLRSWCPEETKESKELEALIFSLYKNCPSYLYKDLDIEMHALMFNAKYTDVAKELKLGNSPSTELTKFYNLANKGDNSFMKTPFYRMLSKAKDKEVLNLRYRFKINQ